MTHQDMHTHTYSSFTFGYICMFSPTGDSVEIWIKKLQKWCKGEKMCVCVCEVYHRVKHHLDVYWNALENMYVINEDGLVYPYIVPCVEMQRVKDEPHATSAFRTLNKTQSYI